MKKLFLATLATLSIAGAAQAASCPSNSKTLLSCNSTPKAGDNEVAAQMLDSISVCQSGSKTLMVVEKSGESKVGEVDDIIQRTGGISYVLKANDSEFHLSVAAGTGKKVLPAKLNVIFTKAELAMSASYTCRK